MKRLFSFLLVIALLLGQSLTAWAQTPQTEVPEIPTQPATEAPEAPTEQPTVPDVTEPVPDATTETPDQPTEETEGPNAGSENCEHSWVYVEVKPTCTEYGAKGYVCIYCEAVTNAEAIDLAAHTYDHACDANCNVCGAERSVTHSFSAGWSKNSTQHWHACTVCGGKTDVGSHYPGPAATEEKAQYCLTCGLMMMPKKAHTHVYEDVFSKDETEHWYACKGCEDRKSAEQHSYDNPCDPDCNICGYTAQKEHDYISWQFDENGHWNTCKHCGYATEPEAHIFDGVLGQADTQRCSVCEFMSEATAEHIHEARGPWNMDDSNHWKLCACGEKMEENLHVWDAGRESEEEIMLYQCTICNAEKTEVIPKESSGISWLIPAVIVCLLCAAAIPITLLISGKKSGKYR